MDFSGLLSHNLQVCRLWILAALLPGCPFLTARSSKI